MTSEWLTVCPACDEPPPRGSTVTPSSRASRDRALGLLHRLRRDDAERHDLVVRGVGGVAAAREAVEMHAAGHFRAQTPFQSGQQPFHC